jgi:hypothetical protein
VNCLLQNPKRRRFEMREEWTNPEVEEFDIAERTQFGDGTHNDGLVDGFGLGDPEIGDPDAGGGGGGGGGAPSS